MTQGRAARVAAVLVCTAVLGAATMERASAAVARRPTVPSNRFCDAFGDYFQIVLQLQIVTAFASLGDSKPKRGSPKQTAEAVRNLFVFVLSPKLELLTRRMAAEPKTNLHNLFSKQATSFAAGTELLRGVGFTDQQLRTLATSALDASSTDLKHVVGKVKATSAQIAAAAKKFAKQGATLDLGAIPTKEQQALARVGSSCGTFPRAVDCATLVTAVEAAAILGGPTTKADTTGCGYDGPAPATGTKPQLGFDVYTSTRAFATVTKGTQRQNVPGIGDGAVAITGFKTFSIDNTCGRTLAVKDGNRTVVVALCLADDAQVPTETLVGLARQILARR